MEAGRNKVYHDYLDMLASQRFYGNITLHFQGGHVESSILNGRETKSEVLKKVEEWNGGKPRRTLEAVRSADGGAA